MRVGRRYTLCSRAHALFTSQPGREPMNWGVYEGFRLLFEQFHHSLDPQMRNGLRSLPPIETPMVFIIGAVMSGTASLFCDLLQHPHTIPCVTREAGVFQAGNEPDIAEYNYCHILYYAHLYATGQLDLSDNPERELVAEFLEFARHCHRFAARRSGYHLPVDGKMVAIDQDLSFPNPGGPEALQRYNPNARLLVILRDPVDRAYSIYKRCRNGLLITGSYGHVLSKQEFKSFEEVLNTDERANGLYLAPGIYVRFLKQWLEVFPREQIMVIGNDELRSANNMEVLAKVFDFIDVPRKLVPVGRFGMEIAKSPDQTDSLDPETRATLAAFYHPHNEELFQLIGRRFEWSTPRDPSDQALGQEVMSVQGEGPDRPIAAPPPH